MISLRPLTDANREAVVTLHVSAAQEQFVGSVEEALVEAAAEPGGRAIYGRSTTARRPSGS